MFLQSERDQADAGEQDCGYSGDDGEEKDDFAEVWLCGAFYQVDDGEGEELQE